MQIVRQVFAESNEAKGISLYVQLPFCESLCTCCGCNARITRNQQVEAGYVQSVWQEWQMYLDQLQEKPLIRELHSGRGTPTFFRPEHLQTLVHGLLKTCRISPARDFSLEGHPNNTTTSHLQILFDPGFERVSFGIQVDPKVQQAVHRIQPFENVVPATQAARTIGYRSVNFDLIYGLPFQTTRSITHTIAQVAQLMPERIAFYSYAHVPWIRPGQRGYAKTDLPTGHDKSKLYVPGKKMLAGIGYWNIGMDHCALPHDALYLAAKNQSLHRNFMGYTMCHTDLLIGLGASAISDAKYGYMQNMKRVEQYQAYVSNHQPAILKSHALTEEGQVIRQHILQLLCTGRVPLADKLSCHLDP